MPCLLRCCRHHRAYLLDLAAPSRTAQYWRMIIQKYGRNSEPPHTQQTYPQISSNMHGQKCSETKGRSTVSRPHSCHVVHVFVFTWGRAPKSFPNNGRQVKFSGFLETVFLSSAAQVVLTKNGDITICILPIRTRGFVPHTPWKPTKIMKMAGVTPAKIPFAKNTVFATPKIGGEESGVGILQKGHVQKGPEETRHRTSPASFQLHTRDME